MELAPGINGFHLEPRCRICRNDQVRTKVNDLLATGASYAMVLRALGDDNAMLEQRDGFDNWRLAGANWQAFIERGVLSAHIATMTTLLDTLRTVGLNVYSPLYDAILAHHGSTVIAQEAIQMQTIVNLVAAGLGLAWVPESVREFQRSGVVYRQLGGRQAASIPQCETTLVWGVTSPVLERFVEVVTAAQPQG